MTIELAKLVRRLIAIEVDANLVNLLKKRLLNYPGVSIIQSDILQTDITAILDDNTGMLPKYKVVANIPYYITSPILRHFLENLHQPQLMVVMVQKEVGEAIVAQPGQMSLLSIGIQFFGLPRIIKTVSAKSFYPQPRVDSVILQIKPHLYPPFVVNDEKKFFDIVRAGFCTPRKQLRNSLAYGMGITQSEAEALLEKAGVSPKRRAETLSLKEWHLIYTIC